MTDDSVRATRLEGAGLKEHTGDPVVANRWIAALAGHQLVHFRTGYGIHLELGTDHEVTIETSFTVSDGQLHWTGEPLTEGASAAVHPLQHREVTSAQVSPDGALALRFDAAALTVSPDPTYEAWQVRGPDGLLIICAPGGDYLAIWEPDGSRGE